jgi:hypothetical protein
MNEVGRHHRLTSQKIGRYILMDGSKMNDDGYREKNPRRKRTPKPPHFLSPGAQKSGRCYILFYNRETDSR